MNFLDKLGNWINEACLTGREGALRHALKGMYPIDTPVYSGVNTGTPMGQLQEQAEWTLYRRNMLFDKIDLVANHHISTTIKDIIISDGFNDLSSGMLSIQYLKDDEEADEEFTTELKRMLKKTKVLDILKDCISNEGMDYSEIFLSTECKYGYGIASVSDDMNLREHLALYKNTELIGVLKFDVSARGRVVGKEFLKPENVSHFMLNYKKIPIVITKNFNKRYNIPEKIRCASPLLTPVIDLIMQYNQLEQVRTAIEINKATQPIIMGIGVSPDQDMNEVGRQLQELTLALNENKNNVINNLETLDVSSILQSMSNIQLVPYNQEEGTSSMKQVTLTYNESNLSEKLNDLKKSIALAVGVPEQYVATATYASAKDTKEDSLLTNPRYSRMLTKIQDLLKKGLVDLCYKHLKYKYSNEQGIMTKKIEKEKIEVLFNSTTDLNDRLEDENMLLNAENVGSLVNVIDTVAASPNIPAKVMGEKFIDLWKEQMKRYPTIRNVFELMTPEEQREYNNNVLGIDNDMNTESDIDLTEEPNVEEQSKSDDSDEEIRNVLK